MVKGMSDWKKKTTRQDCLEPFNACETCTHQTVLDIVCLNLTPDICVQSVSDTIYWDILNLLGHRKYVRSRSMHVDLTRCTWDPHVSDSFGYNLSEFDSVRSVSITIHLNSQLTCRTRLRQRWRLISRLRSSGRVLRRSSSSTPCVATHLNSPYFLTACLRSWGSCLWCIHCSVSVFFCLHSSSLAVIDWRYLWSTHREKNTVSTHQLKWWSLSSGDVNLIIRYPTI